MSAHIVIAEVRNCSLCPCFIPGDDYGGRAKCDQDEDGELDLHHAGSGIPDGCPMPSMDEPEPAVSPELVRKVVSDYQKKRRGVTDAQ